MRSGSRRITCGSRHSSFFLEVGENIWPKHCYPKVLADGKASKRERKRKGRVGGEKASRGSASSSETTVFDEEGGGECDPLLQTHTHGPT